MNDVLRRTRTILHHRLHTGITHDADLPLDNPIEEGIAVAWANGIATGKASFTEFRKITDGIAAARNPREQT